MLILSTIVKKNLNSEHSFLKYFAVLIKNRNFAPCLE